jgi:hypothetical protein
MPGGAMMPAPGMPMAPAAPVVPGVFGPIGTVRSPILVLLLGCVTCGLYWLFWGYASLTELKAFRQRDDINPILFFIPILNLIELWNLPPKVLEAKQMANVPNAQVYHPIFYILLGQYFLTEELNEVFDTARRQSPGV